MRLQRSISPAAVLWLKRAIWKLAHLRILFKSSYSGHCGLAETLKLNFFFPKLFRTCSCLGMTDILKKLLYCANCLEYGGKSRCKKEKLELVGYCLCSNVRISSYIKFSICPQKLRKPCESWQSSLPFYTFLKQVELFVILNKSPPQAFSRCFQWQIQALS